MGLICFFAVSVLSAENRSEIKARVQLAEQSLDVEEREDFALFLAKTKRNVSTMHIQPDYNWKPDLSEQKLLNLMSDLAIEESRSFFKSPIAHKEQLSDMERIASFLGGALVLFDVVNYLPNNRSLFGGCFFQRERINPYDTSKRSYFIP